MNEFPIAFATKGFLISLFKKKMHNYDLGSVDFIEDLFLYKMNLYLDLTESQIIEYQNPNYIPIDKDDEIFFKNMQMYFLQQKTHSLSALSNYFQELNYKQFDELLKKPNAVFVTYSNEYCHQLSREFGVYCFSIEDNNIKQIFEPTIKNIAHGAEFKTGKESEIFKGLPYCNHIIIRDPYLSKQGSDFIVDLVKSLSAEKVDLRVKVFYEMQGTFDSDKQFRQELTSKLVDALPNLKKDNIFLDTERKHNRHIYTNLFWMQSDYGFMKKYSKDAATITTFPITHSYNSFYQIASRYFSKD